MDRIVLARQAERDLRRIGPGEALTQIREAFAELARRATNLDVTPLVGSAPWHRLRVGDYRILHRPIEPDQPTAPHARWLVARVVHKRDLERAVTRVT